MIKNIPFLSFLKTHQEIKAEILKAFEDVYESNAFILGEQVKLFEDSYAKFNDTHFCIGVGNGLDALTISLRALEIGFGDEVIVPANTYIATILAISNVGARPILVEPRADTFNIDSDLIESAITSKTKAIIPVHLYGQACEMDKIMTMAEKYRLFVIEDNAQAQGASFKGKLTGSFGNINATSFYPGKNLGALGDAGAITTNDVALNYKAMTLRNYGSQKKYFNEVKGYNSRLDELQAAFLYIKLKHLHSWNEERKKIAEQYDDLLSNLSFLKLPKIAKDSSSVFHLYVIRSSRRNELQTYLKENGIATMVHYPVPPHLQKAYSDLNIKKGAFPITEDIAKTCLSLPIYPGLKKEEIDFICLSIKQFFNS